MKSAARAAGFLAASAMLWAGAALADGPAHAGDDVVTLKNGGLVRGTVIDAVPGKAARVQLVTGEITTIPWDDVQRITTGNAPAAGPPAATAPPAQPEGEGVPAVRLHVDTPKTLAVLGRRSEREDFTVVCLSPCDQLVPRDWEYRVRGDGVRLSGPFVMQPDTSGRAVVRVDPASTQTVILGMVGVVGGGVITLSGLALWAVGAAGQVTTTSSDGTISTHPVGSAVEPTGIVLTAVGLPLFVVSGLFVLSNLQTSVKHVDSAAPPSTGDLPRAAADVARRVEWSAPLAQLPLLSGRF